MNPGPREPGDEELLTARLGFCGVKVMRFGDQQVLSLFYRLDPAVWGNGVGGEAAAACPASAVTAKFRCLSFRHRGTLCRVRDPRLAGAGDSPVTTRLRLEPAGPANAADLWLVHGDDAVWPWYDDERPSAADVAQSARFMGESWRLHGVHKWIAYDRVSGEVVGRGGLSRTPVDDDWSQIYAFLPAEPWVRVPHESHRPFVAHANWVEIGWALGRKFWGCGYAAEIGRAGLAFAFDVLGVQAVVSCTVRHNVRSRAVMQRIGMRYAGEIRSRGMVEGVAGEQDDAPYAVCVLLRRDWHRSAAAPVTAASSNPCETSRGTAVTGGSSSPRGAEQSRPRRRDP